MNNTDKLSARMLAQALVEWGVKDVVTSPGTRNMPLLVALSNEPELRLHPVVDERSAAFIALGISSASGLPVAIACTSGSAVLNYAPALAEAFYRHIPLIAITADRPPQWIDQADGQTIRQAGALASVTKGCYALKGELSNDNEVWEANRKINEAFHTALFGQRGPVHINVSFDAPLNQTVNSSPSPFRKIDLLLPEQILSVEQAKELADTLSRRKILIVGGFNAPSHKLNQSFTRLAALPNVVVLCDALSNINSKGVLLHPERLFAGSEDSNLPTPDTLITFGGALLNQRLKDYLRHTSIPEHLHVGSEEWLIDSYFSLTQRVEMTAEAFFPRLANALVYLLRHKKGQSPFKDSWLRAYDNTSKQKRKATEEVFTSQSAIRYILATAPSTWNLQLSNGLTVRYAMAGEAARFHRRDCNRGVSGIDGSVSTALGAAYPYAGCTLLITGDMSLQYDWGALAASGFLSAKVKIVVINNGGGQIFNRIPTTRDIPQRHTLMAMEGALRLPLEQSAGVYGFRYLRASSFQSLSESMKQLIAEDESAVVLEVITNDEE